MSDPLRTESSRALEPASEADQDAKIEQLLLAGLDHYFAAQYEHAINVWTRALFLDRSHARARAYIERARSALAERQRESEELLHTGVAAFDRGDGQEARRLLQAAIDQGAPSDEALAVLERLNRLEQGRVPPSTPHATRGERLASPQSMATLGSSSRAGWIAAGGLLLVIAAAGLFAAGATRSDWGTVLDMPSVGTTNPAARPATDALPLPRRAETAMVRARGLATGGHLYDALAALDDVRPTDVEKPEADRLRAEIQKQLIGMASLPSPQPGSPPGERPRP